MPTIILTAEIRAPIERCFDLARSIDFHCESMKHTGERAIAGVTTGLISSGDTVTWRARHLGFWRHLTSRVTVMDRPRLFVDEQVRGAFRFFRHEHRFEELSPGLTGLTDTFEFGSPCGALGHTANAMFLTRYMRSLLSGHQQRLRAALESDGWRRFIDADA
ncbi:MAG: SRPBCC family protein [Phycisphaerales bacterium]|nr:SRPBCC family protein [Phycisphaerales bacterium]